MPVQDLRVNLKPSIDKVEVHAKRAVLARVLEGEWSAIFKGRGIEFAGFRTYTYGDDASLIDWRASLRSKETLIREFEEFKNFTVVFLLDVSDSMLFSSTDQLKCEFAAELTYALADAVSKIGDSVGLIMFNDQIIARVKPNIGHGVLMEFEKHLSDGQKYGGGFDLSKTLMLIRPMLQGKCVVVLVSDFINLKEGWERYVQMMSDEYEVIGIMVSDPRDMQLPQTGGQFLLKDPYSAQKYYVDVGEYATEYEKINKQRADYVETVLKRSGGDMLRLLTTDDYLQKLINFFEKRSKRQD